MHAVPSGDSEFENAERPDELDKPRGDVEAGGVGLAIVDCLPLSRQQSAQTPDGFLLLLLL